MMNKIIVIHHNFLKETVLGNGFVFGDVVPAGGTAMDMYHPTGLPIDNKIPKCGSIKIPRNGYYFQNEVVILLVNPSRTQ